MERELKYMRRWSMLENEMAFHFFVGPGMYTQDIKFNRLNYFLST